MTCHIPPEGSAKILVPVWEIRERTMRRPGEVRADPDHR